MSHYKNLNEAPIGSSKVNPLSVKDLLLSKYNATNLDSLSTAMAELRDEGFCYVELALEISDAGYQHWLHPVYASDRPGDGLIPLHIIDTAIEAIKSEQESPSQMSM